MFTVLRLIEPFLLPPAIIAIGIATSLFLLFCVKYRLAKAFLLATLIVYYLFSIEPIAYFLARSLESRSAAKESKINIGNVEAIVILAGGVDKKGGYRSHNELSGASWRRLWHGIKLYKELKGQVPILYSGGTGDPFDSDPVEAELAMTYAESMGILKEQFWIEPSSRHTFESGLKIKRILDERFPGVEKHKIILVTSAWHMPRSLKVMKKVGIYPIPSATDFYTGVLSLDPLSFLPTIDNFFISTLSIREWLGMAGYFFLGKAGLLNGKG